MKWTKIDEQHSNYSTTSYEDYINEEGTIIHRVWNDGFVEEFEIAEEQKNLRRTFQKSIDKR
jgi:hypothetical protein